MSSIRKRDKGYTQISNTMLNDNSISLKAKGLFAFMDSKPDGWNFTIKTMAAQLKEGEDAVKATLKELKEAGYIKYHRQSSGHGIYELIDEPNREKPKVENPHMEKPKVEKPHVENPLRGKSTRISNKEPLARKIISNTNPSLSPLTEKSKKSKKRNRDKKESKQIYPEALQEWINYRKEIRKPLKQRTIDKLLKDYELDPFAFQEKVEFSISNGYQGLFAPKSYPARGEPEVGSLNWLMQQQAKEDSGVIDTEVEE